MKLDPMKLADWQIAEAAEEKMKTLEQLAAELIVPIAGDIKLLPGTASDPAYRRIDVDVNTGKVHGLF